MPRFAPPPVPSSPTPRESIFYEFGRILEETRRRRREGGGEEEPLPSPSGSDFHSDIPRVGNNAVPWLLYISKVSRVSVVTRGTSRYPIDVTISS